MTSNNLIRNIILKYWTKSITRFNFVSVFDEVCWFFLLLYYCSSSSKAKSRSYHPKEKQQSRRLFRKKNIHFINHSNQINSTIWHHSGFDSNMNLDRENYEIYLQSNIYREPKWLALIWYNCPSLISLSQGDIK